MVKKQEVFGRLGQRNFPIMVPSVEGIRLIGCVCKFSLLIRISYDAVIFNLWSYQFTGYKFDPQHSYLCGNLVIYKMLSVTSCILPFNQENHSSIQAGIRKNNGHNLLCLISNIDV